MATNLRLRQEAEDAVRLEAQRSGRSQQEVLRDAIDAYLGLEPSGAPDGELDVLVAVGAVRRPRTAYRKATTRLTLRADVATADLLGREDRF